MYLDDFFISGCVHCKTAQEEKWVGFTGKERASVHNKCAQEMF